MQKVRIYHFFLLDAVSLPDKLIHNILLYHIHPEDEKQKDAVSSGNTEGAIEPDDISNKATENPKTSEHKT